MPAARPLRTVIAALPPGIRPNKPGAGHGGEDGCAKARQGARVTT